MGQITFIFIFLKATTFCFAQDFNPQDSEIVNANVKYEVNYYVSGGNISSLRILTDGILIKRVGKNGEKIQFVKPDKLDYYQFLKIQLYIDSILWEEQTQIEDTTGVPVFGLPEIIQVIRIDDLSTRIFSLRKENTAALQELITLVNNYLPRKYSKKISIPNVHN